ncbi:retrovirus-related pol polyprotein from transposon TNT 1-94 [Tanacetum coccineum]
MMASSLICLLSKASKTKSWLWHRRLSHLNFGAINHLAKNGLVRGLPKLKFEKDHLCSACAMGKSKKQSHKPKSEDTNQEKLYLLHMDLCGPMRVASINGKKYILVIVDDYSRFTWVKFLASKDEAPDFIIKFLKMIQVRLNTPVRNIRTDNGTEFVNQTLRSYYESVAARTMLIYAKAPLFLWAEAVATACYTQNRSIIRRRHGKTPYELLHDRKPDLSYLYVFGALCYPNNDSEDLGKLQAKADIGIFIGYAPKKKAYRIYNRRTRKIIETIHVNFDELTAMASEQLGSGPGLQCMTPATSSSGLVPNPIPQQPCIPPPRDDWDRLFQPMFDEYFNPPTIVVSPVPVADAPRAVDLADSPVSTSIDQDAPSISIPSTQDQEHSLIISQGFEESPKTPHFHDDPLNESLHEDSTSKGSSSNVRPINTPFESIVEPKNFKQAMTKSSWINAMQEEIYEFERLQVWELVPCGLVNKGVSTTFDLKYMVDTGSDQVSSRAKKTFQSNVGIGDMVYLTWAVRCGAKEEVPLGGCSYTCTYNQLPKKSKLDRFLISESLMNSCPNISAITLERFLSDHRPSLNRESHYDYWTIPFRFAWNKDKGCGDVEIVNKRANVVRSLQELENLQSLEAAQKSKIKWAIEGDENLTDQIAPGVWICSKDEIKRAVWDCVPKVPVPDGLHVRF